MLKQTIIENAIRKARLSPNDSKINILANHALEQGIRKFSQDSTITAFQRMLENVTLSEHTTIGRPVEKRGYRITYVNELPSLEGYDPDDNNFGIIMGVDYYLRGQRFYKVVEQDDEYDWSLVSTAEHSTFCEKVPDIICTDIENIVGITNGKGVCQRYDLLSYNAYGRPDGSYCDINLGNGILQVYASIDTPVTIVYVPELNCNQWEQLPLSYGMTNILEDFIASQIARTAELKAELTSAMNSNIVTSRGNNIRLPELEDF